MGLQVYVGNPRKLLIWGSIDKSDERDARMLALVCRVEPKRLWPVRHRNVQAGRDLEVIKARDVLVQSRTPMINHVRAVVKASGERLPGCSSGSFAKKAAAFLPEPLSEPLAPVIRTIEELTQRIRLLERQIAQLSDQRYPETLCFQQVPGVDGLGLPADHRGSEPFQQKPKGRAVSGTDAAARPVGGGGQTAADQQGGQRVFA
jgi:transposase